MGVFTTGIIVLLASTAVFYVVMFSFIFYWHLVKVSFVVLPAVFAFEFFVMGFCVVSIISIIIEYAPFLVKAGGL